MLRFDSLLLLFRRNIPFLIPAPNIQPNLLAAQDWQTCVPAFIVSSAVGTHILPIHCVALDWLEDHAFLLFTTLSIALHESAPFLSLWPLDPRKVGSASCTVTAQPDHEAADPSSGPTCTSPVIMIRVVTTGTIALRPQLFDKDKGAPSLESSSTRFYAFDCLRARNWRFTGMPNLRVKALLSGGPDSCRLKQRVAKGEREKNSLTHRCNCTGHTSSLRLHLPLSLLGTPQCIPPTVLCSKHAHS